MVESSPQSSTTQNMLFSQTSRSDTRPQKKQSLALRLRSRIVGFTQSLKSAKPTVTVVEKEELSEETVSSRDDEGKQLVSAPTIAENDQKAVQQAIPSPHGVVERECESPGIAINHVGARHFGSDEVPKYDELQPQGELETFTCSPLLSLPLELFQEVTSYLDNTTLWLLRLSCKRVYDTVPTTPIQRREEHAVEFMMLIRDFVPHQLEYCRECHQYHRWTSDIYYWWSNHEKCCRRFAMAEGLPSFHGGILGTGYYVCGACNTRRLYTHCALCMECEACCGPKRPLNNKSRFAVSRGALILKAGTEFYCEGCWDKKICCCGRPILARRACHTCQRCEDCSGVKFQPGRTRCGLCYAYW